MMSKTIEQWRREAQHYGALYYEKYTHSFDEINCSDTVRNYYCKVAKNYWDLRDLLGHILQYGSAFGAEKCSACKHRNPNHIKDLTATYTKYKKWIEKLSTSKKN